MSEDRRGPNRPWRLTRAALLLGAFGLVAACGADGAPETPDRGAALPTALAAR